ncbi:MAG: conserved rane protein of unknown function [Rickettsiales bacterium]|jgi:predicted exporter|nr:conserved rane protein of unknown function [Rickettsiales bacterium]
MNLKRFLAARYILWHLMGALLLIGTLLLTQLNIRNDIEVFLPKAEQQNGRHAIVSEILSHNPQGAFTLIAIRGGDAKALAETSKAFASLVKQKEGIVSVMNGTVSFDPALFKRFFSYRYHLAPMQGEAFSANGLSDNLNAAHQSLGTSEAMLTEATLSEDPTGAFKQLLKAWEPNAALNPRIVNDVWFSNDETAALMVVVRNTEAFELEREEAFIAQMETLFNQAKTSPSLTLHLSSPDVITVRTHHYISKEASMLGLIATILVVGLLVLVFPSANALLLIMFPLVIGTIVGVAAVQLAYGYIHGITLGFGVTLLGLATDYPVHLLFHLKSENRNKTLLTIWLGVITTCCGFGAMLFSDFPGLHQLGLFVVVGLIGAGVSVSFMHLMLGKFPLVQSNPRALIPTIPFAIPHRNLLLAVLIIGASGVLWWESYSSKATVWEQDISRLTPVPKAWLQEDRMIRESLHLPDVRYMLVVEGKSMEEALERSEAIVPHIELMKAVGHMGDYQMAARYLPSEKTQHARLAAIPKAEIIKGNLETALINSPDFAPEAFDGTVSAILKSKNLPLLKKEDFASTPLAAPLNSLLLNPSDDVWYALIPLSSLRSPEVVASNVKLLGLPFVHWVDMKEELSEILTSYREQAFTLLSYGILAVLFVLVIAKRKMKLICNVFLPVALPIVLVPAGVMLFGEGLGLFHLMGLLLVAGIGIDCALFRFGNKEGGEMHLETMQSIAICGLTTVIAFAVLAFSSIPMLNIMGMTVAIGTGVITLLCLTREGKKNG